MQRIVLSFFILASCFTLASCCCKSENKQVARTDSKQMDHCGCGTNCACGTSDQNEHCGCGVTNKDVTQK